MVSGSTRIVHFISLLLLIFLSQMTAGQNIGLWSKWSECSKTCNGEQTRTRKCALSLGKCEEKLEDKRECGQPSCFSVAMIIALAVIGAAILVAIVISIILCRRNIKEREEQQLQETKNMTETIERRYDNSISTSHSLRHFPSLSSFPEPRKEPEEMNLDNFAFDQESLDESIQSVTLAFGTDEEYQPGKAPKKDEEKPVAFKVVSVTETQVIDRDSEKKPQEDQPAPIYSVVVKPKKDAQATVDDAAMY